MVRAHIPLLALTPRPLTCSRYTSPHLLSLHIPSLELTEKPNFVKHCFLSTYTLREDVYSLLFVHLFLLPADIYSSSETEPPEHHTRRSGTDKIN